MNLQQKPDGRIYADFMPSEVLSLVHIVKSAEIARIAIQQEEAKKIIEEAKKAEEFLEQKPNDPQ